MTDDNGKLRNEVEAHVDIAKVLAPLQIVGHERFSAKGTPTPLWAEL